MDILEKLDIAQKLQKHHYFFRSFWDIGNPIVDDFPDLDTAAITFDSDGNALNLLINRSFWNSLNEHTRLFLICHEMLHIILQHGVRFREYYNTEHFSKMNTAADVVINETLVNSFDFNRSELLQRLDDNGCWMDTIFKNRSDVLRDESTEYYFNRLKDDNIDTGGYFSIDKHTILTPDDAQKIQKHLIDSGVLGNICSDFLNKIPQSMKDDLPAGSGDGSWSTVDAVRKVKSKWETVIKKWESLHRKDTVESSERWERVNPRYSHIISNNIHLPTEHKVMDEYLVKDKLDVFFFLDTSGSCYSLKNRFFSAARSLNPKKFNIRLFCFDTRVEELDIKSNRVYGGGGTVFNIIENKIQQIIKSDGIKYPHAVWIITDGYGNAVTPEKPEKWYWFLSSDYTTCIPQKSKVFKLSDFE